MTVATPLLVLGLALAILVGVSLGLLGGGGSILTVPILVYVLGVSTHEAIATSLLVVAVTSLVALAGHARSGRVRWTTGLLFGVTSMIGAYAAGRTAHHVPGVALRLAFGALMLLAAGAMMRGRAGHVAVTCSAPPHRVLEIAFQGVAVGAATGLVGAGGGFVVVPALVLLGGLPMRDAIATSLLVVAMSSSAALVGHLGATTIDLRLAALVGSAAIAGSLGGTALSGRVRADVLRRAFAWLVLAIAVFLLSQEIPRAAGIDVSLARDWPWVLGLSLVPMIAAALDLARMRRARVLETPARTSLVQP